MLSLIFTSVDDDLQSDDLSTEDRHDELNNDVVHTLILACNWVKLINLKAKVT